MSDLLPTWQSQREAYQYPPGECIRTKEQMLEYLNRMGFCLFSGGVEGELPGLSKALCQEEGVDLWGWKDSLPAARLVFYGAVFHPNLKWEPRPGFVSLDMLAPLYSLTPVMQFGGDLAFLRRYAHISLETVAIAEALEHDGSLSTGELRASTNLLGKANASRFTRALKEAQAHFLISKVGVTGITRGDYSYIWNSFGRVFPEAALRAETLSEDEACRAILHQYVQTAVAVPIERIAGMLALDLRPLQSAAAHLVEEATLRTITESGIAYLTVPVV